MELEGSSSNRDGIGATVLVELSKKGKTHMWKQWMRSGGGLASSSQALVSFGFAKEQFSASDQVRVEVHFSSGEKVIEDNITLNQRITIYEP